MCSNTTVANATLECFCKATVTLHVFTAAVQPVVWIHVLMKGIFLNQCCCICVVALEKCTMLESCSQTGRWDNQEIEKNSVISTWSDTCLLYTSRCV